jgi:hypothetical protein
MDDLNELVERARESRLNSLIAACVAVIATFLALCNVKDGNIVQAMAQAQTEAVDQWSYYQSKSTKLNLAQTSMELMTLMRDTTPNASPEVRKQFDERITAHAAEMKRYEVDKNDIKAKAEALQTKYDALNIHDDQFDIAEALLSVAIALFGVTALTQKRWMLGVSGTFAVTGIVFGLAGFLKLNLHPEWLARVLG